MKLNLGCGTDLLEGWTNVDVEGDVDVVHDLNRIPFPWPDNTVDEIRMFHVLEHLKEPRDVMHELWRICKPGARIHIRVPDYRRKTVLWNPWHYHDFRPEWFRTLALHTKHSVFQERPRESFRIIKCGFRRIQNRAIWLIPKIKCPKVADTEVILEVEKREVRPCH